VTSERDADGLTWDDYERAGEAGARGQRLFLVRTKGIIDGFETAWTVHGFATRRAAESYASRCYRGENLGWWEPEDP